MPLVSLLNSTTSMQAYLESLPGSDKNPEPFMERRGVAPLEAAQTLELELELCL